MARFARGLVVTLGFVLLGLFLTMVPQKTALGQNGNNQPVIVKNTPLPISVTNTPLPISGSVSVGNFPATQPVSGSVGLSGPLSVTSGPFSPIFVEPDAFAAAQADELNCAFNGTISNFQNGQNVCTFPSQPAGQNRVVENFGLTLTVATGTVVENAFLGFFQPAPAESVPMLFVNLTKVGSNGTFDYYVGAQEGHVYFQSSTPACVVTTFATNGNGLLSMQCTINGHDVPQS